MTTAEKISDTARQMLVRHMHGTFGDRKVFIAALERQINPNRPLGWLRAELLEMHRRGEVELARCDMPQMVDPGLYRASEIDTGLARYHFIVID